MHIILSLSYSSLLFNVSIFICVYVEIIITIHVLDISFLSCN